MTDQQQPQPTEVWGDPMDEATWIRVCELWPEAGKNGMASASQFGHKPYVVPQGVVADGDAVNITAIVRQAVADAEPITAEWLASCGGAVTAYGSSVEVYRFSEVSVRFVDGKLARVWTGMSEFPGVRTRRDLQTLLGFLGLKSLKETAP